MNDTSADLAAQLEALLVAVDRPLHVVDLATALERPAAEVEDALTMLAEEYAGAGGRRHGFELRQVAGGWRMYVRAGLESLVPRLTEVETLPRLSRAALETLAVIAYRQPVSRAQVAAIRAVNVDSVVRTLLARGLIEERGEDDETGATLFGTTADLLEHLGIDSLAELPRISEALAEDPDAAGGAAEPSDLHPRGDEDESGEGSGSDE